MRDISMHNFSKDLSAAEASSTSDEKKALQTGSENPLASCPGLRNKGPAPRSTFRNLGTRRGKRGKPSMRKRRHRHRTNSTFIREPVILPFLDGNLLAQIAEESNIIEAVRYIRKHPKKAGGMDRKTVIQACDEVMSDLEGSCWKIKSGDYEPLPVLRKYIPKANGKTRALGIPVVFDRIVQRAILQVLEPEIDPYFSEFSFGFRPQHSVHKAALKVREAIDAGHCFVADFDLENYFGSVGHKKLIALLSGFITDKGLVTLIKRFMRAGVIEDKILHPSIEGVPQGGPLSPLLGNLYLHALDSVLTHRGHVFVRYADDFVVLTRSRRAAYRVRRKVTRFLADEMGLKVNLEKTKVIEAEKLVFLGLSFHGGSIHVSEKKVEAFKTRVLNYLKSAPRRTMCRNIDHLREYVNGWNAHYGHVQDKHQLLRLKLWYIDEVGKAIKEYDGGGKDPVTPALTFWRWIELPDSEVQSEPADDFYGKDDSHTAPLLDAPGSEDITEGFTDGLADTGSAL